MSFSFATCERGRALGFIAEVYPNHEIADTPDCAGPLLDFVEKDVVRVQDPMMHGKSPQVIQSKNWDEALMPAILSACGRLTSKPKTKEPS